ncbi:MAG: Flp family type IVb pilin [Anaerolineales bacterium]
MNHPREVGQGLLEYGLLIVIVAILVLALVLFFGQGTGNLFSNITTIV